MNILARYKFYVNTFFNYDTSQKYTLGQVHPGTGTPWDRYPSIFLNKNRYLDGVEVTPAEH